MNYAEALEYVEGCKKYGVVPGLSSIRRLLSGWEIPRRSWPSFISRERTGRGACLPCSPGVLARAGYRTGSFSSPELLEHRTCSG